MVTVRVYVRVCLMKYNFTRLQGRTANDLDDIQLRNRLEPAATYCSSNHDMSNPQQPLPYPALALALPCI